MTAPSSSERSFFREYFLFRLNAQKIGLVMCTVFGMVVLPGSAYSLYDNFNCVYNDVRRSYDVYEIRQLFFIICLIGLLIMPVIGAVLTFVSCNRKKYTDMIGGLPLTHKERFWGDFLSGYTAYVAPIILAGVITMLISIPLQDVTDKFNIIFGIETTLMCTTYVLGVVLSLFALLSLMYIISAVAVMCCGRPIQAEIMSIVLLLAPSLAVGGISACFVNAITGLKNYEFVNMIYKAAHIFPPLGLMLNIMRNYDNLSNADMGDPPHIDKFFTSDFTIFNLLYMLYVIIFAAALTALAYYLSKSRRQEQTGLILVYKAFYRVISVLAAGGAASLVLAIFVPIIGFGFSILIASGTAAIIILLLELVRKPAARDVVKSLICWVGTVVCCVGIYLLFDKTGAFGHRYINVPVDKVESVRVYYDYMLYSGAYQRGVYEITDKSEIEKLTNSYNDTVKEVYGDLRLGGQFEIDYMLTDGTRFSRWVSGKERGTAIPRLINAVCRLDSFPEMQSTWLAKHDFYGCEATLDGIYGELTVPEENISEFKALYADELREKYYHAASEVGGIVLVWDEGRHNTSYYPIAEDYTRTINYLKSLYDNSDFYNDNTLIMEIKCVGATAAFIISVNIYRKDMNSAPVKELISLLKRNESSSPDDDSDNIKVDYTGLTSYYVPKDAENRVFELMLDIAERSAE